VLGGGWRDNVLVNCGGNPFSSSQSSKRLFSPTFSAALTFSYQVEHNGENGKKSQFTPNSFVCLLMGLSLGVFGYGHMVE